MDALSCDFLMSVKTETRIWFCATFDKNVKKKHSCPMKYERQIFPFVFNFSMFLYQCTKNANSKHFNNKAKNFFAVVHTEQKSFKLRQWKNVGKWKSPFLATF